MNHKIKLSNYHGLLHKQTVLRLLLPKTTHQQLSLFVNISDFFSSTMMNSVNPIHNKSNKLLHCCAPGCTTYDVASQFLRFPTDSAWREKWLAAMPKRYMVIDHNSVLCLKHFAPVDVVVFNNCGGENNGNKNVPKSALPRVKEGACPMFFPNELELKTSELKLASINNPMFEVYSRDYSPETFGELESLDATDFILDFFCLKRYHYEKLNTCLRQWNVYFEDNFALFYILDCTAVPKIATSVKISKVLLLSVHLNGREMDTADLAWIVPLSGKVNRWSQLKVLLQHFSSEVVYIV